jgi:hypothetical protein
MRWKMFGVIPYGPTPLLCGLIHRPYPHQTFSYRRKIPIFASICLPPREPPSEENIHFHWWEKTQMYEDRDVWFEK